MAADIQVVNYSIFLRTSVYPGSCISVEARKEFIMSTRTARKCLYLAVGTAAAFTICPLAVAAAEPTYVQCYQTVAGPVCLDLTPFTLFNTPSDDLCMADPPDPRCVDPSLLPPDASVRWRPPNGQWSSDPVPVSKLPAPLSLSKDQWPPGTPPDRWESSLPGGPPPAVAAATAQASPRR